MNLVRPNTDGETNMWISLFQSGGLQHPVAWCRICSLHLQDVARHQPRPQPDMLACMHAYV